MGVADQHQVVVAVAGRSDEPPATHVQPGFESPLDTIDTAEHQAGRCHVTPLSPVCSEGRILEYQQPPVIRLSSARMRRSAPWSSGTETTDQVRRQSTDRQSRSPAADRTQTRRWPARCRRRLQCSSVQRAARSILVTECSILPRTDCHSQPGSSMSRAVVTLARNAV